MNNQNIKNLLSKLEPFIFTFKNNIPHFNLKPFDRSISNIYDCSSTESESFYNLLRNMDKLTFGDQGMAMEGWVYFDCSAMPGAIVGLGLNVKDLDRELIQKLDIPKDYKGLVPLSMFIAIPMVGDSWFGHNLCSLKSELGEDYRGLGILTKAMGIEVMKIKTMYGATQWGSHAINIHSKLAPMQLISSHTPVHTHKNSLAYKSVYSKERTEKVLNGDIDKVEYDFLISSKDLEKQKVIQKLIESGDEFFLVGKPDYKENEILYKIIKAPLNE